MPTTLVTICCRCSGGLRSETRTGLGSSGVGSRRRPDVAPWALCLVTGSCWPSDKSDGTARRVRPLFQAFRHCDIPAFRRVRPMSDDDCCPGGNCTPKVDRRDFVRLVGIGLTGAAAPPVAASGATEADQLASAMQARAAETARLTGDLAWPSLRVYDRDHLARIALPLGGIGTGTVSLGGRGDLRDWEMMNRPGKGFVPVFAGAAPFFALYAQTWHGAGGVPRARRPGGRRPVRRQPWRPRPQPEPAAFPERVVRDGLSVRPCRAQLIPTFPLEVHLKAFNPLVPTDAEASSIPLAAITVELRNASTMPVSAAVCATLAQLHRRRRVGDAEGLERRSAVRRREAEPQRPARRRRPGRHLHDLRRRRAAARGIRHHRAGDRRRPPA